MPALSLDELAGLVRRAERPMAWGWVASRKAERWVPTLGVLRGATRVERCDFRYPGLVLCVEQLTPEEAASRITDARLGSIGTERVGFTPPTGPHSCTWRTTERAHHQVGMGGWPYLFAELRLPDSESAQLTSYEELVGPGQPLFVSALHAAAELLFAVPLEALGNDRSSRIIVALPDRRGAIKGMRLSPEGLAVHVRREGTARLRLRATWRMDAGEVEWKRADREVSPNETVFPLERAPYEMTILLVTEDGDRLDRRGWTANYGDRPDADVPTPAEQVERWLTEREHEQLEYKQQLGKDNNDAFARDVCAFANTKGGVVLIGVTDDRHVVGYPADGAPVNVEDQVASVIRDRIDPEPPYDSECVMVRDRPVWLVRVAAGPEHPYVVDDVAYVRVKGQSRRANRRELIALAPAAAPRLPPWER